MVYLSVILPVIPDNGVVTFSVCSGSYISKAAGTTGFGKLNNFRFPVPTTFKVKSNDSPLFKVVFDGIALKSNFPTAPSKSAGFPASGKAFTEITFFPAETRLLSSVKIGCPQKFRLFVGT